MSDKAKQAWISAKIAKIAADNPNMDPKQRIAIAYSMYKQLHSKKAALNGMKKD